MFKREFDGKETGVLILDGDRAILEGTRAISILVDLEAGCCECVVYDADGKEHDATITVEVLESFTEDGSTFLVSTPTAVGPGYLGPDIAV